MNYRELLILAVLIVAAPGCASKIFIDYDSRYDFSSIETFKWEKTEDTSLASEDPLLHSRIVNGIEHYLTRAGVREVDGGADIRVTYHTSTRENLSVNTSYYGYGYPRGWYGGYYGRYGYGAGFSTASTTVTTYETGTLLVDAWDPDTEELVWRGTATEIMLTPNPDKMGKRIDAALDKIARKWEKMKEKDL